ncbi:thioredoxin-2-like [Sitodiplosis mosellana]|uniref:thioredoxin-2-like n=1 Tax=Sitodiplosis mosellana TaxID=263140 RepID=UPI00244387EC|nr:thioredoxin-2-like [Sitodiplosis mosellana]
MKFVMCLFVSCIGIQAASSIGLFDVEIGWKIIETEAQFDEQLKNAENGLVVVEFCVKWASPCLAMEQFSGKIAYIHDNVVMVKVDIEEMKDLGTRFNISAVPAYVFLKDGEFIESFLGFQPDHLEKTISKLNK